MSSSEPPEAFGGTALVQASTSDRETAVAGFQSPSKNRPSQRPNCSQALGLFFGAFSLMQTSTASATTAASELFCQKFPEASGCDTAATACAICHAGPPALNFYGQDLKENLSGPIETALISAIQDIATKDSDGDGSNNYDEINQQGAPGNPHIKPYVEQNVVYDPKLAFKRIKAIYCGESATYDELSRLDATNDATKILHDELSRCLETPYWTKEALFRLADKKIQPLAAVGFGGNVVIGDYRWDYRLFAHVMSGDRDVRELLSADYHIDESGNPIQGIVAREEPFQLGQRIVIAGGQPLPPERRAGMMTTQWFLSSFTMFAQLPRNTAAQVYRAYLGLDLAKGEGLNPVDGEPRDVDNRHVAQSECAVCHSTLDPLAYAFSTYKGIETGIPVAIGNPIGTYDAGRTPWEGDGKLFGQQVDDLLHWAEIARNSDDFKRTIALMLFEQALSRGPTPAEKDEFDALWRGLAADGYSVNRLLHRFIDTKAFGGRSL